jgi:hypothetical protein
MKVCELVHIPVAGCISPPRSSNLEKRNFPGSAGQFCAISARKDVTIKRITIQRVGRKAG